MNRTIRNTMFALLLAAACIMPSAAATARLKGERLSVRNGLPCNTVNNIVQDDDGFLWMATANGLSRYDGYSFLNMKSFSSLPKRKTTTHVALLFNDDRNRLMWVYTPQHSLYCYDLTRARFVDYTGTGDQDRQFYNRFRSTDGIWLYDDAFGVRHVKCAQGKFTVTDYTKENGMLPDTKVLIVKEDTRHNVWIACGNTLVRVSPDGRRKYLPHNGRITACTVEGEVCAVLTDEGGAYVYDSDGRLRLKSHLPSVTGFAGWSRCSMISGGLWYIFTRGETYAMDMKTGAFSLPEIQIPNGADKNPVDGYKCIYDREGNLWLFGKIKGRYGHRKLHLIDNAGYIRARDKLFSVAKDNTGRIFIASYGKGLYVYNPADDTLDHYSAHDAQPVISSDFLLSIFIDRSNCIWVSSESGVDKLSMVGGGDIRYVKPEPQTNDEWSNMVRAVSGPYNGRVMVSTKSNNLYSFDYTTNSFTFIGNTPACVYAYYEDPEGHVWMGTKGAGMSFDGQAYTTGDPVYRVPTNNFYAFRTDRMGRTWIATWEGGLLLTNPMGGKVLIFRQFLKGDNREARVHSLLMDGKGRLWVSTDNGIIMVDTNQRNITEASFKRFNTTNGLLPFDEIMCSTMASDGSLWFGALGGLMRCRYVERTGTLEYDVLDTGRGLVNNSVRLIQEDANGYLWCGTEEGMSRIDYRHNTIKTFMFSNVTGGNIYSESCSMRLPDGRMLFGTGEGLAVVSPEKGSAPMVTARKATVTDMAVNGISLYKNNEEGLMKEALSHAKTIELPHDRNTLTVYFSNFDYSEIKAAIYQYYLEGVDNTWNPITSVNHAEYTDLNPGTYTFHLRTMNADNKWSEETVLRIVIVHPWYATWWAWLIYIAVLAAIAAYMYRTWRRNFDLHQQMAMEKQIAEFRLDFFTHISHEFRTPLAIIQGSVNKVMNAGTDGVPRSAMQAINRGTRRLMRLVNQLMEFRKVDTGSVELNVERADIVSFVRDIYQDLWMLARQKEIMMTYTPFTKSFEALFDKQKVETMVYNLLSNAVKYTGEKGTVRLTLRLQDNRIVISVEDNGPGITQEQERVLFKPFMHGYVSQGGMGIGLYTAQKMAALHKGTITYQRATEQGGCIFTVTLPADETVYTPEEHKANKAIEASSVERTEVEEMVKEVAPQPINNQTVVIIEDDADMMEQIRSEMAVYFNVKTFMNGRAGLEGVRELKPALVICDVMMPEMNGFEVASALKGDDDTRDIPVILLTALDDPAHIMKGYKAFADDYMVKPCNFRLLIARSLQLVTMAVKRRSAAQTTEPLKPEERQPAGQTVMMSAVDKNLKDRIESVVAQHIGNQNFSIDSLAELLGMGRTKVYYKIKEITGVSPNTYIKNERLRIAAEMILSGEYSLSEISEKVGFMNYTYFYRCFKERYGVPPNKYGRET